MQAEIRRPKQPEQMDFWPGPLKTDMETLAGINFRPAVKELKGKEGKGGQAWKKSVCHLVKWGQMRE